VVACRGPAPRTVSVSRYGEGLAMGAAVYMASLGDDPGAPSAPVLPMTVPGAVAGLLLGRPRPVVETRPGLAVSRRSAALVSAVPGFEFVEVHGGELTRVAVNLRRSAAVVSVVICPRGVPAERTALAVAVAGLLRGAGVDGRAVVTCAVCPPLGVGRSAIPHEVSVRFGNVVRVRHVWEIVSWADIPDWLAALSAGSVAA